MEKRGQITLFIVLGIILLLLIVILIYFRTSINETISEKVLNKNIVLPKNVEEVQNHIQGCVSDMSLILLYQLGSQGGLLNPSADKALVDDEYVIAYGYNNGRDTLPSLVDLRRDFSTSMNSLLPLCLQLTDFGKLNIQPSKPSTSVEFLDDNVRVSVDYPVTVSQGENIFRLDDSYEVKYPIRVKFLHSLSDGLVKKTISDINNIDVSYLLGLGVRVDIYPYDDKTFVYSLEDYQSVYKNVNYQYRFAVRHAK